MNYKSRIKIITQIIAAICVLETAGELRATPYASGLTNNAGTVSYFLNESADTVKVILNNGAGGTNSMPTAPGKYSFSLGANTIYKIEVTKASGPGYATADATGTNAVKLKISSDTNPYLNFEYPRGIEVNRNPKSPYFGRLYATDSRENTTVLGRACGIGIYMINPDGTSAHQPGQENTPLRPSNWPLQSGVSSPNNTVFPYELTIGPDDNIYVCDFSDLTGNLWVTDPEIINTGGSAVLKLLTASGAAAVPIGTANSHGSINAAHVEGSLASNDLKVWTIDEDMQDDRDTTNKTQLSSLWRYDIGGTTLPYPSDASARVWTASGKQGVPSAYQTMDMVRGTNGYFYITDLRSAGNESGLSVVDATGTPLWNSWTASQAVRAGTDILLNSQKVAVSPDCKYVAVARATGFIWILPLTNGIPNMLGRLVMIPFSSASKSIRALCFDAAGNLYAGGNSDEIISIFSPGGATVATTESDATGSTGIFTVAAPATTVSASAPIATVTESGGTNGVITLTRSGNSGVALTVSIAISGTATNSDYAISKTTSVTFAPFATSTNIFVTPTPDSIAELTETVTVTVLTGSGYSPGFPSSASVSILDDETPELSFVPATAPKLLESYATSKATVQLQRRGLLTSALTANLSYSGAATRNADFAGPSTVSVPAGAASTDVTLTAVDDQVYEGDETATINVISGSGYVIGTNSSANVTVVDDEYPSGTLLFSDDFETNSSSLWIVNIADTANGSVTFNYDYSAAGIPAAPGSSTTLGLRFDLGNTVLQINGASVSPTNGNFVGDYRLKFNMWINYNGPLPDGGDGSTQNFDAGVGTTGDHPNWKNSGAADGVWFSCTGDGADGPSGGDYDAFIGGALQNDDTGFYAAGTGAPNSGVRNAGIDPNSHPFYAYWGGVTAPAAQLSSFVKQTGVSGPGNAGMAWHTVVITKVTNTVIWSIDGIAVATVTNDPTTLSTNVFVGYQDIFATGKLSDVPAMSFGLVDNLRVESFAATPVSITAIQLLPTQVQINFKGDINDLNTSFKLQSSSTVNGSYLDDNSASITATGPGTFQATVIKSTATRFYRIKR